MAINQDSELLASASRTATTNSETKLSNQTRGGIFSISITSAGASGTITPKIQGKIGDNYYDILTATAISTATGTITKQYKVYPGITAVANNAASDIMPEKFRVQVTHSATTSWTYSVNANMVE